MNARVQSLIAVGMQGIVVDVECHLSNSLPNIVIVGFANKSLDEAKERLRGSFANSHLQLPKKRITINLAPADVPKDGSGFDFAIAVAILLAGQQLRKTFTPQEAFIGELGLDGSLRAIRGIIGKLLAGKAKGITTFYVPRANLAQATLVPGIKLVAFENLEDFYRYANGQLDTQPLITDEKAEDISTEAPNYEVALSEISGQEQAKRALIIAAAGGHNIFFSGPPGTGKSMLAKALPSLLPPMSREEMLEVTHLHSLAGGDYERIVTHRPFRSPHHSASHIAVVGGGHNLRPGEISLSHRGILLFDELPEFNRVTLEALRQPLEDRLISVSRAKDTAIYPANFMLVATANPCPCGYYGTARDCSCLPHQIARYRQKISGPILDRIDLYAEVADTKHRSLLSAAADKAADRAVRDQILGAHAIQSGRYKQSGKRNADMTNRDLREYGNLLASAKEVLDLAAERLGISARSYMRTIKVARTIADLEGAVDIGTNHISEALAYRGQNFATSL